MLSRQTLLTGFLLATILLAVGCGGGSEYNFQPPEQFPEITGTWTMSEGGLTDRLMDHSYTLNADGTGNVHVSSSIGNIDEDGKIERYTVAKNMGMYMVQMSMAEGYEGRLLISKISPDSARIAMSDEGGDEWPIGMSKDLRDNKEGWGDAEPSVFVRTSR